MCFFCISSHKVGISSKFAESLGYRKKSLERSLGKFQIKCFTTVPADKLKIIFLSILKSNLTNKIHVDRIYFRRMIFLYSVYSVNKINLSSFFFSFCFALVMTIIPLTQDIFSVSPLWVEVTTADTYQESSQPPKVKEFHSRSIFHHVLVESTETRVLPVPFNSFQADCGGSCL